MNDDSQEDDDISRSECDVMKKECRARNSSAIPYQLARTLVAKIIDDTEKVRGMNFDSF
jgi:hypothetical protein